MLEQHPFMAWVGIPLLIFTARLIDVSLATLRHILVFRGIKRLAPLIGFAEALVWVIAITQIMQNLHSPFYYLAWAFGFAAGTYCGILLEEKLALGYQLVRIITNRRSPELTAELVADGFGLTVVQAKGSQGTVDILFVAVKRRRLPTLVRIIQRHDPTIFFTIEDVRTVAAGVFGSSLPQTPSAPALESSLPKEPSELPKEPSEAAQQESLPASTPLEG